MTMSEKVYYSENDFDAAERLYQTTDTEYQNVCIGYMYGVDTKEAAEMRDTLSENDIADACDYFSVRGLPLNEKQTRYYSLVNERAEIAREYELSPIEAIVKRDEIHAQEFSDAVSSIPEPDSTLSK